MDELVDQLFVNHLFYHYGSINGYLESADFEDYLARTLRNVRTGSGGELSLTNRLDGQGFLRQELNGLQEFQKSSRIQRFVNDINVNSPVYPNLPDNQELIVYRSFNIPEDRFNLLVQHLSSNQIPTDQSIFPHPLPFSASWTSELSEGNWSYANVTLKIKLPLNYPFLPLSCPKMVKICNTNREVVEERLRQLYRKLPQVLNQSQLELLIMPTIFYLTGEYQICSSHLHGTPQKRVLLTARPVLMDTDTQRYYLRAHDPDEITFEETEN